MSSASVCLSGFHVRQSPNLSISSAKAFSFYYTNVTTSSRYIHFINTSLVLLVHRRHLHHLLLFNSSSTIMVEYSKIVVGSHSASSSTSTLSRMLDASHLHSPSMVGFFVSKHHTCPLLFLLLLMENSILTDKIFLESLFIHQ